VAALVLLALFVLSPAAQTAEKTITWTAVGDDGLLGTASTYDIRISTVPITPESWTLAVQLDGEPTPQVAGSLETYILRNLEVGRLYYVALKTADEVPNWSEISNVLVVLIPDTTPPAGCRTLALKD
jgi:hypothetical protein